MFCRFVPGSAHNIAVSLIPNFWLVPDSTGVALEPEINKDILGAELCIYGPVV